ncbi:MAG: hypothetical protein LBR00_07250 [Clostridiales Family XIII bacterium]|jgi:hypothetical protein|nr:hypothetical protein [Clostridiales Family XIII bacterium]
MHEGHDHSGGHGPDAADKTALLLQFTLEHNRQHALEIQNLADKLRAAGKAEAAALLEDALRDYETGNEKFAHAIEHL